MHILEAAWQGSGKFRLGVIITGLLILLGVFHTPLTHLAIGDIPPQKAGSFKIFLPPSRDHWLGTDRYGRDVLGLVLVGLPVSLSIAAIAGGISTIIGAVVGFVAGYKGNKTDAFLRTTTDMFLVIPTLPLIIVLSSFSH